MKKIHIGFIPDGNRRWCKKNNLPLNQMAEKWMDVVNKNIDENLPLIFNKDFDKDFEENFEDIREISLYIASIENMSRDDGTIETIYEFIRKLESKYLEIMKKLEKDKKDKIKEYINRICVNIIGEIDLLPKDIKEICSKLSTKRNINPEFTINLAFAYDAKKDILNFANKDNKNYNRIQSDIDLVIRTGSERRLSGFFPIHTLYSELFFIKSYWPEFSLNHLEKIIKKFKERNRRFGK